MGKPFGETFGAVGLSDGLSAAFSGAYVEDVSFSPKERRLSVVMRLNSFAEEGQISALEAELSRLIPNVENVTARCSISLTGSDKEKVDGHKNEIISALERESVFCASMVKDGGWSFEEGDGGGLLKLTVPKGGAFLFARKKTGTIIERVMAERLGVSARVAIVEEERERTRKPAAVANLKPSEHVKAAETGGVPPRSASADKSPAPKRDQSNFRRRGGHFKVSDDISGVVSDIGDGLDEGERVLLDGLVFRVEERETKTGKAMVSFDMTDGTDSVTVKFFAEKGTVDFKSIVKTGLSVRVYGSVRYDDYNKEIIVIADEIAPGRYKKAKRRDDYPFEKRVELHLHTRMSKMDAVTSAEEYVKRAAEWGHPAIAITDHGVVQAFPEAFAAAKKAGVKILYGTEGYLIDDEDDPKADWRKLRYSHVSIIAKNLLGLRNLYELVSLSHVEYFKKRPCIPKSLLRSLRDGLIIGSACEAGELYRAVMGGSEPFIKKACEFYDYYEIMPTGNNEFLIRNGKYKNEEALRDLNRQIYALGKRFGKPVVATGDAHFIDPEDSIYRAVIQAAEKYKDADLQAPLYYRTTQEMLDEFDYLGQDAAIETVITNTRIIADMCEDIRPIPAETFAPHIEGAEDELRAITTENAKKQYGDPLPPVVADRLERELHSIISHGFAVLYITAQKLVKNSVDNGYVVGSRGSVGSSFAATMAGITEVNPLQPHYYCPVCRYSDFDGEYVASFKGASGCDMDDRDCPVCGAALKKDGHDIPFETFLGFDGDKEPDIDLNFSGEYQAKAHAYTAELFGKEYVFKAGTIGTLADKTAFGCVGKYLEERDMTRRNAEKNRLVAGLTGVKRTTGQHPGGLVILPKGHSIYEFTPVQRPADDPDSGVITTHFEYHGVLEGHLLKLDILGHDVPTIIRRLKDITGIDPVTADVGDEGVMSLFTSPERLGVSERDINCKTGTFGIPEFGTPNTRQMLTETKPSTFAELVRISGLSHGTNVWNNNARDLIRDGTATLKEVIPTRDDIMVYLINKGVEKKAAFKIMENVRKGKGLTDEEVETLKANHVPDWYIESCKKIEYMFPKGHAVAYVLMSVRIGWFKLYHPAAFYAAIFSVKANDFDYVKMCRGEAIARAELRRLSESGGGRDMTAKDESEQTCLELVIEMYARGIQFAALDLYNSAAEKFEVTENGELLPPLCSVAGLGGTAAQAIVMSRCGGAFLSVQDLAERAKINKTVIESLKEQGILDGLPDGNQVSLFEG